MLERSVLVSALVLAGIIGCSESSSDSDNSAGHAKASVYIGDDGRARHDNMEHPQVVRLHTNTGTCTAWLSSSNTLTTNIHCTSGRSGFVIEALNSHPEQQAAFAALGSPIAVIEHPGGEACWGADLAVLVYNPANAIPRTILKPLPIMWAEEEPECDGDDPCVMVVGAGLVGDEDACSEGGGVFGDVNQLYVESGLGDGHCDDYDDDMLYGEYDFDDSTTCKGDSGSPVIWRASGEVMAVHRGRGGDGGDDSVGPILWSDEHSARGFFLANAAERDGDGIQAGYDNCDLVPNPLQEDWNHNDYGDACEDSDRDGLVDGDELAAGTDPIKADSDGDGLTDGEEVKTYGTNPLAMDSDNDGLTDGEEVNTHRTNPLVADSDGDGLIDGEEVNTHGTNPLVADTDGDGLTDGEEVKTYGTNPLVADSDGDGLTDFDEVRTYHTNPLDPDTDGDLLNDGLEIEYGLDPLDTDTDDDGLVDGKDSEFVETAIGRLPDSVFQGPGNRNAILNHLKQAQAAAKRGQADQAAGRLAALRWHIDECGATAGSNDWIQSCPEQLDVRELVDLLSSNLNS